jgi:hypothetical protein
MKTSAFLGKELMTAAESSRLVECGTYSTSRPGMRLKCIWAAQAANMPSTHGWWNSTRTERGGDEAILDREEGVNEKNAADEPRLNFVRSEAAGEDKKVCRQPRPELARGKNG